MYEVKFHVGVHGILFLLFGGVLLFARTVL